MFKFSYILFFCIALKRHSPFTASSYIVIQNISIVDVVAGRIIPHQTVIIKDSIISEILLYNNQKNPANAKIIDGKNKFLMPGLWDMHFHMAWDAANDTLLFNVLLKYSRYGWQFGNSE
jgi:imidazolonepropionase-like amidohydrolase